VDAVSDRLLDMSSVSRPSFTRELRWISWITDCSLLGLAGSAQAGSESELAARMLDYLSGADCGASDLQWRQSHPGMACKEGSPATFQGLQSEEACFVCSMRDGGLWIEYRFYLPDQEEGERCELRGVYVRRQVAHLLSDARVFHGVVERMLAERHPDEAVATELGFEESPPRHWKEIRMRKGSPRTHYL